MTTEQAGIERGARVRFNGFADYIAETTDVDYGGPIEGVEGEVVEVSLHTEPDAMWFQIGVLTDDGRSIITAIDEFDLLPPREDEDDEEDGEEVGV